MDLCRSSPREVVSLEQITSKIGSGATPKGGKSAYKTTGISLIRSLNVYDLMFEYNDLAHIDDNQAGQLANVEVRERDILLNITGASVARCCLVPANVLPARVNQHVAIIRTMQDRADPRYVMYSLVCPENKNRLLAIAQSGATREALTQADLRRFRIILPHIDTQHKVASVIQAYDDLIENNLRRIAILEEMAQAIYREWFVEFKYPGHEKMQMADSELGLIPEEWKVAELRTVATLIRNSTSPAKNPNTRYAHYSIPAFDATQMPIMELGRDIRSTKYVIDDGCVLVSKLNPRIPRVWLPFVADEYLSISSTEFLVLSPVAPATRMFLYSLCLDERFLNSLASSASGTSTSHQRVKPEHVMSTKIVLPREGLIQHFTNTIQPMYELAYTLRKTVMTLREARDLLLPQLISGELNVNDIT